MHVVNTGIFPLDVLGQRLVSGQDAVVHVTEQNSKGYYVLIPGLAFYWWEQLGLFLLCLVPAALSLLIRDRAAFEPARAVRSVTTDGTGEAADSADDAVPDPAASTRSYRRRLILIATTIVAIIASVAVVTFTTTQAAITAKVTNTTDTAGSRTFFSCRNAISSLGSTSTYVAWALGTAQSTTTNETDLSGNNRNGRYLAASTTSTSVGCLRDTPAASVTFNGTSQCLYLNNNYATSGYYPNTFSLEAWFRTSTTSNGKIIGFGSSRNSASDGNYDRHVYLDKDGRIVFGVYPNAVKIVYTAAGKSYADGSWHHVVATLSAAGQFLYVDGKLADSETTVTSAEQLHGYWKVGCGTLSGWRNAATDAAGSTSLDYNGPSYFTGQIQYAAVYTIALSAAQVYDHYQAGVS